MAQILSGTHVSAWLKHQLKLASWLTDPANTKCPELFYQKHAVNTLTHCKDTTSSKHSANPPTIDLLSSDANDNNDNDIETTRLGGNKFFFYL